MKIGALFFLFIDYRLNYAYNVQKPDQKGEGVPMIDKRMLNLRLQVAQVAVRIFFFISTLFAIIFTAQAPEAITALTIFWIVSAFSLGVIAGVEIARKALT